MLAHIQNTIISMQKPFKMNLKPIKTPEDYQASLNRLEEIFDARPGTEEGDELEVLSILIERYEAFNFPIDNPDPIEAILFRMDQMNLKQKDLASVLGLKSRVSEVLSKKRKLTLGMIRKLSVELKIPIEVLVKEY